MSRHARRAHLLFLLFIFIFTLTLAPIGGSSAARRVLSDEESHDDDAFLLLSRPERLERLRQKRHQHRHDNSHDQKVTSKEPFVNVDELQSSVADDDESRIGRRRRTSRRSWRMGEEVNGEQGEHKRRRHERENVPKETGHQKSERDSSGEDESTADVGAGSKLPAVHILNIPAGVGLGQIVDALVPILETLKHAGYERFAVHECGGDPPWKTGWDKLVSCEARPERNNIYHNFKRTYEIGGKQTLTQVVADYEKYDQSGELDFVDGHRNDWSKILNSKEIYGKATKMLIMQKLHNKYRPDEHLACENMPYWFDEPVNDLLELVKKPESEMHKLITFHIRTMGDEHIGIAFNEDLTLNEDLAQSERDKRKSGDNRINRVKAAALEFPDMVKKMVEVCTLLFEKTGKKTHVAVDSQVVRNYLRKHEKFIQVTDPDVLDFNKHYKEEPLYSLNDIADWYLLSLGREIVGFPSSSTFSYSAACRGASSIHYTNTLRELTSILDRLLEDNGVEKYSREADEKSNPSKAPHTPVVHDNILSTRATDASVPDLISSNSDSKCVYGYPSTNEENTCICNTDWTGERCEVDPIPSCDRETFLSCGDILYRFAHSQELPGLKETVFPSCQCADECVSHLLNAYGDAMYKRTFSTDYKRFDPSLHLCTQNNKVKRTLFMEMDYEKRISKREEMGEVWDNATQEESRKVMTKLVDSKEQKATNCSPDCERFGGGCVDYECVLCKEGRFGMDCAMSKKDLDSARLTAPKRKGKKELSLSYLDLPGTIRRFIRGQSYQNHGSFRGVHYFEHSLRKDAEIFDPNPPTSETSDEERKDIVAVIPFFPSDTVGNVGMAQIYASRVEKYVNDKFMGDVSFPTIWFNAQDRGFCTSQKSRDALPSSAIGITQYGQWRGHPNDETPCFRSEIDIVVPSSVSRRGGYYGAQDPEFKRFDEKTKDGFLLFFAGSERSRPECLGEEFFKNLENNCMYSYGGGARGWIVDWFKDEERFWLNRKLTRSMEKGDAEHQAEAIRMRSKFCLSSGGNGFDQRFIDGISRGCVPVLTQLNTSHPFEILLNYESFTIRAPGEMMRDLPEVLEDTVSSGKYAKMLLNLRVVREAIAWNVTNGREENDEYDTFTVNNGAYYHTLAAIALRTKKKLPESVAEKLCKLYFENEYHENAWKDVLNEEFRRVLEPSCEKQSR